VPRDTVIGDLFGDHVRISPINPERGDSMRFEFVWTNSGQPHLARLGDLVLEDYGTVMCDLTFAVRTDTDVFTESWPHHVVLYLQAEVKGRYRLRQVAAQGEHLREVDFLLDKDLYFTVRERTGDTAACVVHHTVHHLPLSIGAGAGTEATRLGRN
jgi:hypothetical protein